MITTDHRKMAPLVPFLIVFIVVVVIAVNQGITNKSTRPAYPGEGVYGLTEYQPCIVFGSTNGNEEILDYDFKTNSTKIEFANESEQEINISLYDINQSFATIGTYALASGEIEEVRGLTALGLYKIGIISSNSEYRLKISD